MTTASSVVKYEKRDRVAWIGLNRPEAMNALNPEISVAVEAAINDIASDDDILVVVLYGEGGRAFCTGMDLKWRAQEDAAGQSLGTGPGPGNALQSVGSCPKPVIAAIDGYCLAGGMQLSLKTRLSSLRPPARRRGFS